MPNEFQEVTNVDTFIQDWLKPADTTATQAAPAVENNTDAAQTFFNQDKPTETATEETKKPEEADVEKFLKIEKEEVEDTSLIKDPIKFSEILKEKALLEPYEDGTYPQTEEELINALEQSIPYKVQTSLDAAWKEKVENLPPSLAKIHEYAEMGVTTAQQLAEFTSAVANTEIVSNYDPAKPEDQEQIVLLQLMNTGISEATAREEVADLKERNRLESRAKEYFPGLKKAYQDEVARQTRDKAEAEENVTRYVTTNAANAQYFLEKDTDYLPFKFATGDKNYKQSILQLAAQTEDRNEDGTPVFAWQRYIESLQFGDENSYKKYMKLMAYAANMEKYEEGLSKKAANSSTNKDFKKIKTTQGTQSAVNTTEPATAVGSIRPSSTAPWGTRQ
jgi:hypothetical protein